MTARERIDLITALVEFIKLYPSMPEELLDETTTVIKEQYKFLKH